MLLNKFDVYNILFLMMIINYLKLAIIFSKYIITITNIINYLLVDLNKFHFRHSYYINLNI
jgi:hypothetical protein